MQIHLVYFMNIIRCWSYNYKQKLTTSQVVMTQQGRQMLTLNHIKVELFWKSESQSMLLWKSIVKESDIVWKIRDSFPEPTSVGTGWVKLVKGTACSKLDGVRDCRKPTTMSGLESIKEMQDKGKRMVSRRCLAIWLSYMFNL